MSNAHAKQIRRYKKIKHLKQIVKHYDKPEEDILNIIVQGSGSKILLIKIVTCHGTVAGKPV